MLYADVHCHSNPVKGLGSSIIAKKFKAVGGWFIGLVALPPYHYDFGLGSIDSYVKVVELLRSEKRVLVENGLKVRVFMGFHPAEVDEYVRRGFDLKDVIEIADSVFKLVVKYHSEGLIDGIGEIGRQHYSTDPVRHVASEVIMLKAFEYSRDYDLPLHLHLEQGGYVTVSSVNEFVSRWGVRKDRVLFHHVDAHTSEWCERYGYWYSIPAKKKDLGSGLKPGRLRVLVESDFIDDPKRPGVSSYPWDIAKNIEELVKSGLLSEELVYRVMVDHVVSYYGVEPP